MCRLDCFRNDNSVALVVQSSSQADKNGEVFALKKSVKDQVHSLEARGRQMVSVKADESSPSSRGFHGDHATPTRSKSENPITRNRPAGAFTYLPTPQGMVNYTSNI